jgi:3-phytase
MKRPSFWHSVIGIEVILIFSILIMVACRHSRKPKTEGSISFYLVTAQAETRPVPQTNTNDAADDPAIWINFFQPDSSRIIGTDKQGGIGVYDLSGREVFYYKTGKMNNVDLRYGFPLVSDTVDIIAVSNRTDQSIDLFRINREGSLSIIHKQPLLSRMTEEVYGLCMYQSKITGKFFVFVNDKNGNIEQWELFADGDNISGNIVRNLKLPTQTEGMVADDEYGLLYVGEEDKGIWSFNAEPSSNEGGVLLSMSSEKDNNNIVFDIEGLALYTLKNGDGYLVASSQGNDSYAVFKRKPPNKYLGSFKIVKGAITDGSEETDGLEITSFPLGEKYPAGLLVVQDGHNEDNGKNIPQNYKLVRWDSIAIKFKPPLE